MRWKRALILFFAFIAFSIMITLFPTAFIFDLASKATETTVQSPKWSDFLLRISLITIGGVVAMVIVINLLEKLFGREDYF